MNGSTLREVRERAGLRQKDLAALINSHTSTISKIEHGTQDPPLGLTVRWVRACGQELSIIGPEHDAALRAVAPLTSEHADLVLQVAKLLPSLHPLRVLDLRALVALWRPSAGSQELDVNKLSSG
jgi:transcriptional regulator with XRE-family HTH domain